VHLKATVWVALTMQLLAQHVTTRIPVPSVPDNLPLLHALSRSQTLSLTASTIVERLLLPNINEIAKNAMEKFILTYLIIIKVLLLILGLKMKVMSQLHAQTILLKLLKILVMLVLFQIVINYCAFQLQLQRIEIVFWVLMILYILTVAVCVPLVKRAMEPP